MPDRPAIIKRMYGPDYTGPLSHFDEWHALEYGVMSGFLVALMLFHPALAGGVMALVGIKSLKELATGDLKRQIVDERHYFGSGLTVTFAVTATILAFVPTV